MNKCKSLLLALMAMMALSSFAAPKKNKGDEPKRVYLCGVSIDFNDSVAYMTDLCYIDSVLIDKDGSLQNYSDYSHQLKTYLEGTLGEYGETCALIYSEKKSKLERRMEKIVKRLQTVDGKTLLRISADAFTFTKE